MSWLTETDAKEELSIAYLHAVAAHRRLYLQVVGKDRDSVDAWVHSRGKLSEQSVLNSVMLGVQLKARTGVEFTGDTFPCVLSLKNFNDLCEKRQHMPRILVVLLLPREEQDRLSWCPDELVLRRCAYWSSLAGLEPESRGDHVERPTVTVRMRAQNTLTPDSLYDLMLKVSCGQEIKDDG